MKNIPNLLTLQRLAVLPFFVAGAYFDTLTIRVILLCLYIITALTDFFDGYIARNYNASSDFGRIFDPISDKAFIIIVLLVIIVRDNDIAKIILVPFCFIVVRELVISGIREGLSTKNVVIKVSKLGKYKTVLQIVSVGFLIAGDKIIPVLHNSIIGIILLWVSTIITIVSAYSYIKEYLNYFKNDLK